MSQMDRARTRESLQATGSVSWWSVSRFSLAHPLGTACLLVAVGSGIGYAVASASSGGLQDALFVASTTLVFGALLGGVVKFLLEDLQRLRGGGRRTRAS
jgi:hypothetical protein